MILLAAASPFRAAGALDIASLPGALALGPHLQYLEDPDHQLSVDSLLEHSHNWQPSRQKTPNFGFTHSAYWFRLPLHNSGSVTERLFLELAYPVLDHADIYYVEQGRVIKHYDLGDRQVFYRRPIAHHHFVTPLTLAPDQETLLLIRLRTEGTLQLPLQLWDQHRYFENQGSAQFVQGIYFGFMIIMALYNLFLYLSVKDRNYLYYVLYVVSIALMQACLLGYAYQFFWPASPTWQQASMPLSLALVIVSISCFTQRFLRVETHCRWMAQALRGIFGLAVIFGVTSLVAPYAWSIRMLIALGGFGSLACLGIGAFVLARGDRVAHYYLLAWSALLVGGALLAATRFGWLPSNGITVNALQFGSALEALMLSLALAARIKQAREQQLHAERERVQAEKIARLAQAETLQIQEQANRELEEKVQQRTQELQDALEHLSSTTAKLEVLSRTDTLTRVYNRRFFNDSYGTLYEDAARERRSLAICMVDIDHFKQINDQHGHLAGDQILKEIAQVIKAGLRPTDIVARFGGEEFILVLPDATAEDAFQVAERIRQRIEELQTQYEQASIRVTASMGLAAAIPSLDVPSYELIAKADKALYEAKDSGRNRICPFLAA